MQALLSFQCKEVDEKQGKEKYQNEQINTLFPLPKAP